MKTMGKSPGMQALEDVRKLRKLMRIVEKSLRIEQLSFDPEENKYWVKYEGKEPEEVSWQEYIELAKPFYHAN